jgi:hypothetical protein
MTCMRCREEFGLREHCQECGIHKDTKVMSLNSSRRRKIGGKRGRNSGKVSQHGKKG